MKKARNILLGSIAAGAVIICTLSFVNIRNNETAYVKLDALYNGFQMKKELENKLTNVEQSRKTILDSLALQINMLKNNIMSLKGKEREQKISLFETLRSEYVNTEKRFTEDNAAMNQQYSEQIMKQLNEYVKQYGEKENYKYVFGAAGNGSLMYAANSEDITEAVLTYVNESYKGNVK